MVHLQTKRLDPAQDLRGFSCQDGGWLLILRQELSDRPADQGPTSRAAQQQATYQMLPGIAETLLDKLQWREPASQR